MEPSFYSEMMKNSVAEVGEISPESIKPRPSLILARKVPPEEKIGSIIIPGFAQGERGLAVVMAVNSEECPFKVGEVVIHSHMAGAELGLMGMDGYVFLAWGHDEMTDLDVLGTLVPEVAKKITKSMKQRDKKIQKKKLVDLSA